MVKNIPNDKETAVFGKGLEEFVKYSLWDLSTKYPSQLDKNQIIGWIDKKPRDFKTTTMVCLKFP